MHTIKLKVKDRIYDKILLLLNKFDESELQIITEDKDFLDNKRYLASEIDEINSGQAAFMDFDDVNAHLDRVIAEFENPESKDEPNHDNK